MIRANIIHRSAKQANQINGDVKIKRTKTSGVYLYIYCETGMPHTMSNCFISFIICTVCLTSLPKYTAWTVISETSKLQFV